MPLSFLLVPVVRAVLSLMGGLPAEAPIRSLEIGATVAVCDRAHDLPPPAIPISWREVQGFAG